MRNRMSAFDSLKLHATWELEGIILRKVLGEYEWPLYLVWESTQENLTTVQQWMGAIDRMIWMPHNLVFVILHALIVICVVYIIGDWVYSSARRAKRMTGERREKQ